MTKTPKFVNAISIFLFLLLVIKNVDAIIECETDKDCLRYLPKNWKCIDKQCKNVKVTLRPVDGVPKFHEEKNESLG
ncbi:unnamed protein product [Trifolium pratense]|uniref:Uncharacterized protein n=1 Tax=Trifolium pratense TaxID=57577 RepID=A0ACB0JTR8_TRIPR|nr:unnamed protein product [Trifolium pratense]